MKQIGIACAGILLMSPLYAHDSYLKCSLESVSTSPLFNQSEKELLKALPEFFTHICVKQIYFGDAEQRSLKPFVETTSIAIEAFKPIKDKLAQLREQVATQEEQDTVNFVRYLVDLVVEWLPKDDATHPLITRTDAGLTSEATRRLVLQILDLVRIINTNVNSIIGNISAPCT